MKSGLQSRTGFRTPSPEGGAVRRAAVSASPERFRRHPAEGRTPDAVPEPQECSPLSETPASAGAFVLRRLKTGRALLCAAALLWLMQAAAQSPGGGLPVFEGDAPLRGSVGHFGDVALSVRVSLGVGFFGPRGVPGHFGRTLWGRSAKCPTVGRITLRPQSPLEAPGWA